MSEQTDLETRKLLAETIKLEAEIDKVLAETSKINLEKLLYPFVVSAGVIVATGALAKAFFSVPQ